MPEIDRADDRMMMIRCQGFTRPDLHTIKLQAETLISSLNTEHVALVGITTGAIMSEFDVSSAFIPSLHKPSALLPIARHRASLLYLVETFQVVIVVGQAGSGKTTQIPQFLEQAGWCQDGMVVAVTQVGEFSSDHYSFLQSF